MSLTRRALATLVGLVTVTALADSQGRYSSAGHVRHRRCAALHEAGIRGSVQRGLPARAATDAHETESGRQHCAVSRFSNALRLGRSARRWVQPRAIG